MPNWLESIGNDVAHAARGLRRRPMLALAAVLALAMGLGATWSLLSVLEALVYRPLPVAVISDRYWWRASPRVHEVLVPGNAKGDVPCGRRP